MALQSLAMQRVNFPNDYDYTRQALIEELILIERHARDGSWRTCSCIPSKHLPAIAGLGSEGYGFSDSEDERVFMESLMSEARLMRRDIDSGKIRSKDDYDLIRGWARESRKRLERKIYVGEYSTEIEYREVPESVNRLVEEIEAAKALIESENPLDAQDIEIEYTAKMLSYLSKKYDVPSPKTIRFVDACDPLRPNALHIQKDQIKENKVVLRPDLDELVFCKGAVTAHAIAHEFKHYLDHYKGSIQADERKANIFAEKETRNNLYTDSEAGNTFIKVTENNLTGKRMSFKITKAQQNKGLSAAVGLTAAKLVDQYDASIVGWLGPLGTGIGKIAVGGAAAFLGLTKFKADSLIGDVVLFGGLEMAITEIMKMIYPVTPTPGARVVGRAGPVAVPLTPGRAQVIPGASSVIGAAAPFQRTYATPTRLTSGYPQVARADGKFIQVRV